MSSLQDTEAKARRVGKLEHDCTTLGDELKRKTKQVQDLENHSEQVLPILFTYSVVYALHPQNALVSVYKVPHYHASAGQPNGRICCTVSTRLNAFVGGEISHERGKDA